MTFEISKQTKKWNKSALFECVFIDHRKVEEYFLLKTTERLTKNDLRY